MKTKNTLGVVVLLCGIALVGASLYIKDQVEEGKVKIASAEKTLDTGSRIFSLNPTSKVVGKVLTDSAGKKINEGEQEILKYEQIQSWSLIAGIAFLVVGTGIIFTRKKK